MRSSVVTLPLRKCWRIDVKGLDEFSIYGPSAGKVRYQVYLDVTEAWGECEFSEIRVRRHPELDQRSDKTEIEYVPQY